MPENINWMIFIPVAAVFAIMLPLQIYATIHLFGRMKTGQEFWIVLIFMFGVLGVAIYFIMPVSRQPRIRKDIFKFLSGEEKEIPK